MASRIVCTTSSCVLVATPSATAAWYTASATTADTARRSLTSGSSAAPGAALLPDLENLRAVSAVVAEAVYHAAVDDGVATKKPDDLVQTILDTMWLPTYEESQR